MIKFSSQLALAAAGMGILAGGCASPPPPRVPLSETAHKAALNRPRDWSTALENAIEGWADLSIERRHPTSPHHEALADEFATAQRTLALTRTAYVQSIPPDELPSLVELDRRDAAVARDLQMITDRRAAIDQTQVAAWRRTEREILIAEAHADTLVQLRRTVERSLGFGF